jgi:hypothetical protein
MGVMAWSSWRGMTPVIISVLDKEINENIQIFSNFSAFFYSCVWALYWLVRRKKIITIELASTPLGHILALCRLRGL